eukprot:CAMPEP_0119401238 /NCGR_PEP_ID=MMETSP1334-20130426/142269_1 /TAXON_ID=127549 /ORGANISM="Calcidiscus leptoporus, Strain RCC1130" /LENGTH=443 /DNA_ID=CAMNT_0007425153 /DNA_START=33 /DNA_END=1364 /DNA_ORIENTATION=+
MRGTPWATLRGPLTNLLLLHTATALQVLRAGAGAGLARAPAAPRMVASMTPEVTVRESFAQPKLLSGLRGQALEVTMEDIPSKIQIKDVVPARCFKRDTAKSLFYAAQSTVLTLACGALGCAIPMKLLALPLWAAYAAVTGTVATGCWVVAHECGHGAFCDNRRLQTAIGYVLHSALLVPYFSWQRSHAVHHAHTNHITEGETHVPLVVNGRQGLENVGGEGELHRAGELGRDVYGAMQLLLHLLVGWPAYLLFGATGGPKYGASNHFIPARPFSAALWPANWPKKVWLSDAGIVVVLGVLSSLAFKLGVARVLALYALPLMVTNMWLVGYTWLQHTDVDVPHLAKADFSFMRGAFLSIDRPYGPLFDFLHHRIGSTHVAHHIDCAIPHYHAKEATNAIKTAFPKAYLYDPTPVHQALWRVARNCIAVKREKPDEGRYIWAVL